MKSFYTLQFWLLCLSSFLFFSSFNMLIPELPNYLTSLGGEDYKGLIISLFTVTAGLSRPFSGKLTDTVGRIPIMIYGVIVCIVCGFLYPILTTVVGFLFLRFVHGMSTGFKPTATSAYVADLVPFNKRGEAMGIMGLFGSIGMAAGPAIGSAIALHYSLNTVFYASSFMAFLSVLVLAGMKETLKEKQKFSFGLLKISPKEVLEPNVFVPSILMMCSVFSFGVVLTISPDFSEALGLANKGLFYTTFTLASVLIRVLAGKVSDKYGRYVVMKVSLALLCISMIYLGWATTVFHFIGASILYGISVGMNSPTLFAWTVDLSDERFRGRGIATMFISLEIGIGAGALLSGFVYGNNSDNIAYTFWMAGAVAFVGLLFLLWKGKAKDVIPSKMMGA
ncbi:MFS transporter [Flammeovirgaceae bacterium SG7u.111]|nr:MFS transporter [Flammeovirgaceae bacterium SG7u.132]WPO38567.1 MFS transporter [Flammeovirgaceae bacterium SG7u.111]